MQWHVKDSKTNFYIFSLIAGFICLIRPSEFIVLFFPLFIGVTSAVTLKEKLKQLASLKLHLIIGLILFLMPILPQLILWKIQSGQWFFFSYGTGEGFFWKDPQIANVLFSYRKGFFTYTPIMMLSIVGIGILYKKNKNLFLPILLYLLVNLYLISSWWDWAYGASFGMRALVHTYVFMVIPLAYFVDWILIKSKIKVLQIAFYLVILFSCVLNVFQSNLYKHGIIDFDGMTKEAYWFTFFKKEYTQEDFEYLKTVIKHPNYVEMRLGNREH